MRKIYKVSVIISSFLLPLLLLTSSLTYGQSYPGPFSFTYGFPNNPYYFGSFPYEQPNYTHSYNGYYGFGNGFQPYYPVPDTYGYSNGYYGFGNGFQPYYPVPGTYGYSNRYYGFGNGFQPYYPVPGTYSYQPFSWNGYGIDIFGKPYSLYPTGNYGIGNDADIKLTEDDNGDQIILETGETLSILLENLTTTNTLSNGWVLDTDILNSDIIKSIRNQSVNFKDEQWFFVAKGAGVTKIRFDNIVYEDNEVIKTFEVEVIVEE